MHALLDAFFGGVDRLVAEHGGHVDKHIGDCVMAVFGAPVAHGNDAERAVRAALAIRDAMPELSARSAGTLAVHVGVAGGQVVASGTGSAAHREYTVTGDTVNLASRLTDAAAAGEILISHGVRAELGGRLEVRGRRPARGQGLGRRRCRPGGCSARARRRPEQQPARRPRGELTPASGARGRRRCETGRGQAVLLRGEAGIGKTRLVEEVQRAAREPGFACHTAWVLDFGAGTGRDAIRSAGARPARAGRGDEASRCRRGGRRASSPTAWSPTEDGVFLNDLLDLPQPTALRALYEAMDNARRNRGKRALLARLVERASRSQPRLLVVEDVHWADRDHARPPGAAGGRRVASARACCCMTSRLDGDPIDTAWRGGRARRCADDHRPRPAAARRGAHRWPGRSSHGSAASPSAASSVPPATRCSSSSCCGSAEETASEPACPGRCRAWSRRASIGSTPPTRRPCRRPRCSASASSATRSTISSASRATTRPARRAPPAAAGRGRRASASRTR